MSKTRWIIFGVICVIVLGGLALLSGKNKVNVDNVDASKIIASTADAIGDNVYGNKDSKVVVYEYGDFQCPSCGGAYPHLKAIKETYKDQIAFVFRNFPLTTIHPNALSAAAVAEAAGVQGKYWEMHNQLYENQDSWSSASASDRNTIFEQYAENLGLNLDKYRTDLTGKPVTNKIARDRALTRKLNLDSTPTLFINGTRVSDDVVGDVVQSNGDKLREQINQALKANNIALPQTQ